MTSMFKIVVSSDLEYNELCAEIFFDDQFVAILTQEEGFDHLLIEIHPPQNRELWIFKYSEFEEILKTAKETLWNLRKVSNDS